LQALNVRLLASLFLAASVLQLTAHAELEGQITLLTERLTQEPSNAELYLSRADVRRQHAEFNLAFADIATASRLKPEWSMPLFVRARTLFDARRFQEAETTLEKFLMAETNHATGLLLRGRCNVKLGRPEKAIADYTAALRAFVQPNPELYTERAQLQASLGRFDEAIRGLDDGNERLGVAPTLQLAAIRFERQRGNFDSALQRMEKLLQRVHQPETLLLQAQLLEQAGRLTKAQESFRDLLRRIDDPSAGIRLTEALSATHAQAREGLARVDAKLLRKTSQVTRAATEKN
jgi:tetratricopeptide (TPR) repeat protein